VAWRDLDQADDRSLLHYLPAKDFLLVLLAQGEEDLCKGMIKKSHRH
jgi:hypothetical protein